MPYVAIQGPKKDDGSSTSAVNAIAGAHTAPARPHRGASERAAALTPTLAAWNAPVLAATHAPNATKDLVRFVGAWGQQCVCVRVLFQKG